MPIYLVDFLRRDEGASTTKGIAVVVAEDPGHARCLTDDEMFAIDGRHPAIARTEPIEMDCDGVVLLLDHVEIH